jgi:hypothetical protein
MHWLGLVAVSNAIHSENFQKVQLFRILTMRIRATSQPSVPTPRSRHLTPDNISRSREGKVRHLISFKLSSAADTANLET